MDDHLDNALRYFGLEDIDFQRIAVTEERAIQSFFACLKVRRLLIVNHDTRKNRFIRKYGKLYIVELDVLLAIVSDEFKSTVQGSVDEFFDKEIYQAVLPESQPEHVEKLVREKVRFV